MKLRPLLILLSASAAFAADPAPVSAPLATPTPTPKPARPPSLFTLREDRVRAAAPIKNFRLPTFTAEGYRALMLRAGEAVIPDPTRIDVRDMELTLFTRTAEEQIDAMLAAPSATFLPDAQIIRGEDTVRFERADITVTGAGWTYEHLNQKLLITRDAHITLHAPIGDVIK